MNRNTESLNKYISSKGLCSRREADRWIEQGRVTINGRRAVKGNRVALGDEVTVDGELLDVNLDFVYLAFNKPVGITSTTDRHDKTNIIDFIDHEQRIFPIGRLDKDSTGLILLTNDGDIVNKVLRAENAHEKEYVVRIDTPITPKFLTAMSRPIPMMGKKTMPARIEQIGQYEFKIVLIQGLNRQIRRMCEYCGANVVALTRTRIMHIRLGKLKQGHWRYLSKGELRQLHKVI